MPYSATYMQTMAEALAHSQARAVPANTSSITLSMDVDYTDVWTDPAMRAVDTAFTYPYSDKNHAAVFTTGLTTLKPFPLTSSCETTWAFNCRVVINYEEHIDPIWSAPRAPDTCVSCHSFDGVNPIDGQLDLSSIQDPNDNGIPQRFVPYNELFFNDAGQEVVGGMLSDIQIQVPQLDGNGDPIFINGVQQFDDIDDPNEVQPASMSTAGARFSYFIEKMTETELNAGRSLTPTSSPGYVDHANMLTPAELRLISEWIDIGGQYYNNPFHPQAIIQ